MKALRIILLVLIIIGIGLLLTQRMWVSPLVNAILAHETPAALYPLSPVTGTKTTTTSTTTTVTHPKQVPAPSVAKVAITGSVTLSPTCPVERIPPDPACAPKPYATMVDIQKSGSSQTTYTAASDAAGMFHILLEPGTYTFSPRGGAVMPRCTSQAVTVVAATPQSIPLSCDTGIR